jgi:hypothetical protein
MKNDTKTILSEISYQSAAEQKRMRPKIARLLKEGLPATEESSLSAIEFETANEHADIRPVGARAKVLAPEKKKKRKLKSLADLPSIAEASKKVLK